MVGSKQCRSPSSSSGHVTFSFKIIEFGHLHKYQDSFEWFVLGLPSDLSP